MQMKRAASAALVISLTITVGVATSALAQKTAGYLSADRLPDATTLIGPPPAKGSGAKRGDVATFKATRRLKDTPRWAMAIRDAEFGAKAFLEDISCALGVTLTPQNAPALFRVLDKASVDADEADHAAKAIYKRPRPFIENGHGPICVPKEPWLVNSFSYPSGHSTFSWTAGLILADLAPDHAAVILGRARAYGESRVVCGVHYPSDIQGGRVVGAAVFTTLENDPAFKSDLDKARQELTALRAAPAQTPDPAICKVEQDAVDHPIW